MLSTGSPLLPEGFDYVYREVKEDVHLASISGGTDIISCFVLGNPTAPVYRGEIQCAGLGMAVEVFDESGRPVVGRAGRAGLHRGRSRRCRSASGAIPMARATAPRTSSASPASGTTATATMETEHDGFVIHGRSDAMLNPGGVRIGTAEIYRQVERLDQVVESIAIGQEWDGDVRVVLFVQAARRTSCSTTSCEARIKRAIREHTSPRHVPGQDPRRSRTSRARAAARSPSWRCATSFTGAR